MLLWAGASVSSVREGRVFTEEKCAFNALETGARDIVIGRLAQVLSLPDSSLHVLSRMPLTLSSFSCAADTYVDTGPVVAGAGSGPSSVPLADRRRRCDVDIRAAFLPWHMGGLADNRKGHVAAGWRGSAFIEDGTVVVESRSRSAEVAVLLPTIGAWHDATMIEQVSLPFVWSCRDSAFCAPVCARRAVCTIRTAPAGIRSIGLAVVTRIG